MTPREKAKQLLMQHLPSATEQDCDEIIEQIISAVKQDVVDLILHHLETGTLADITDSKEKQKEYEAFSATWKRRFSQPKMTDSEFAKTFGKENTNRLNNDLLEMILKGAEIG
ncbi:MAG: hypothetical protein SWH61_10600 [Thermodesulfobacteriota bacterium]|nr:hypothetical protein [Thermodesulfobacteriota bacterium]